jgi:hypothetical protein
LEAEQHAKPEEENNDVSRIKRTTTWAKQSRRRTMISIILRLKGL